jgi:hypothetical protein
MQSLKQTIMRRDNLTSTEANNLITEAREALYTYLEADDQESAYNICEEFFGLEPDYLMELL